VRRGAALAAAALALAAPAGAAGAGAAYRAVAVPDGGTIRGAVRLAGTPPRPAEHAVARDAAACGATVRSPRLTVGPGGGVANAFVYLEGIARGRAPAPPGTVTVEQRGCVFAPYAVAVPAGTQLEALNSDPVLHTVRAFAHGSGRALFNVAQPFAGQRTAIAAMRLAAPGLYELSCDAGHPWMSAWVLVTEHPYAAVTGPSGEFALEGVPPGSYRLRLWHPGVKLLREIASLQRHEHEPAYEAEKPVAVRTGAESRVDFELRLR
jgi:plastocyanin